MDTESALDEFLSKYKLPLAMGVVGVVLLIGGLLSSGILSKTFVKSTQNPKVSTIQNNSIYKVDVSGEVLNPGVYQLPVGSRIEEAIKAAGGIKTSADPDFVAKNLNLAQKVSDGMKIYVPKLAEANQAGNQAVAGSSTSEVLININTAPLSDLDKLPGVGEVTAQKIIDSRPFGSLEELLIKKAVSKATYEKIKDLVSTY